MMTVMVEMMMVVVMMMKTTTTLVILYGHTTWANRKGSYVHTNHVSAPVRMCVSAPV